MKKLILAVLAVFILTACSSSSGSSSGLNQDELGSLRGANLNGTPKALYMTESENFIRVVYDDFSNSEILTFSIDNDSVVPIVTQFKAIGNNFAQFSAIEGYLIDPSTMEMDTSSRIILSLDTTSYIFDSENGSIYHSEILNNSDLDYTFIINNEVFVFKNNNLYLFDLNILEYKLLSNTNIHANDGYLIYDNATGEDCIFIFDKYTDDTGYVCTDDNSCVEVEFIKTHDIDYSNAQDKKDEITNYVHNENEYNHIHYHNTHGYESGNLYIFHWEYDSEKGTVREIFQDEYISNYEHKAEIYNLDIDNYIFGKNEFISIERFGWIEYRTWNHVENFDIIGLTKYGLVTVNDITNLSSVYLTKVEQNAYSEVIIDKEMFNINLVGDYILYTTYIEGTQDIGTYQYNLENGISDLIFEGRLDLSIFVNIL